MNRARNLLLILLLVGCCYLAWPLFIPESNSMGALKSEEPLSTLKEGSLVGAKRRQKGCDEPVTLRVGEVDPEFSLRRSELEEALRNAMEEWRDATGHEWFQFGKEGELAVNLLFDGRQESLLSQQHEERELVRQNNHHTEKIVQHEKLAMQFAAEIAAWSESSLDRVDAQEYEEQRQRMMERLERQELFAAELREEGLMLAQRFEEFRRKYPPQLFKEGEHLIGGPIHEINIYVYQTEAELHFALLHELGHAIGLQHIATPGAVMNPVRELGVGDNHLTSGDVAAALALCARVR